MKCKTGRCAAACCYNVPFANHELERFAGSIVSQPVEYEVMECGAILPHTVKIEKPSDVLRNKCPFLRHDFKCDIYEDRPEVCRLFGQKELPCKFIRP